MRSDMKIALFLAILMAAGLAGADTRIVQHHQQDSFTMMGQTQPAVDEEHVTWIGDRQMRIDQGTNSTIVQLDAKKLYIVDHDSKSYTEVDLPVDLATLLPPGMAEQMMSMMSFEVTVAPTDETKKIGDWNAKRYNLTMTSAMMSMDSVLWASTETPVDYSNYFDMYSKVMSLQPGVESMTEEMRKIEGFVVAQEAKMSMKMMGDVTVGSTDQVVSIDQLDAPSGTYAPPAAYERKDFDFMKMMQGR